MSQNFYTALYKAIVIGVSAGGFDALKLVLSPLPENFPLAVIIVQHLHETSDNFLARHLDTQCALSVKFADEKEEIIPGQVYIAPAGYHLLIEQDKTFSLSIDDLVNYTRPSVDVLFESASDAYGDALIGVILTGANRDGSQGIKKIKENGGLTVAQSPQTAASDTMPKAAIATHAIDHILELEKIPSFLIQIIEEKHVN